MTNITNIEAQILRLLQHNPYVILPGVGAFYLSKEKESGINQGQPVQLRFNEQLQLNDGLLTQTLMDTCGLSEESATHEIIQYVNQLFTLLNDTNQFRFSVLGIFISGKFGTLQFNPSEDIQNYFQSYTGKVSRAIRNLSSDYTGTGLKKTKNGKKIFADLNPVAINQKFKRVIQKINLTGYLNPKTLKYAGLIISGVILSASLYYFIFVKTYNSREVSALKTDIPEKIWDQINLTKAEKPFLALPGMTEKLSHSPDNKILASNKQEVSDTKYFLVTGSFSERVNAEQFADELDKKGYEASILVPFNGGILYRVVLEPCTSHEEALKKKENLVDEIKNIWIMNLNLKYVQN